MKKANRFLAGALAGTMCLSLAACGSGSSGSGTGSAPAGASGSEAAADDSSTFNTLYSGEVQTLNYLTTSTTNDYAISANVIDCLVDYDQYGNIKPGLAESWESNDDQTVWTFHIRKGVKWVDSKGKEKADVTANDWVTTAKYVNDAAHECDNQYMYDTGAIVKGAQEYYDYTAYMISSDNGTKTTDEDGNAIDPVPEASADDIGVTAPDDYTLVYTLDQPCPFFLSIVSYTSYMPVAQACLDEYGDSFGLDNDSLWYNGAYILSTYEPQEKHVLTKNESYWDKDNVHIGTITSTYNADASSVEAAMYKSGEIDTASISADLLDSWLKDDAVKDQVHGSRPDVSFSYFYCFNFDPEFDAEYEPDNWKIAVNNENFRKAQSVMPAFSVIGLACIVGGVVSAVHDKLLMEGITFFLIVLAVVFFHNGLGYVLGYSVGKMCHFSAAKNRTISIEVGMQNAGLATVLASEFFIVSCPLAVIPCAVSCAWHSISGTIMAQILAPTEKA